MRTTLTPRMKDDSNYGKAHPPHALVVDDDEGMRRTVVVLLRRLNFSWTTAANGAEAIKRLTTERFDVVLTDMHMPEMNGIELLEWLQEHQAELPAVLMTGVFTAAVTRAALQAGVAALLNKPFGPSELLAALENAFTGPNVSTETLARQPCARLTFPQHAQETHTNQ